MYIHYLGEVKLYSSAKGLQVKEQLYTIYICSLLSFIIQKLESHIFPTSASLERQNAFQAAHCPSPPLLTRIKLVATLAARHAVASQTEIVLHM